MQARELRSASSTHHAALLLFVFLWGGNFVLAEVALRELAPISFSVTHFMAAGAVLAALMCAQRSRAAEPLLPRIARGDWPRLLVVAVLGATLAPWLGIEGLGLTHGARASLWLALGPVFSSGIGYLLGNERIGHVGYAGIALAAVGTFGLAADGLRPEQAYWLGDLLLLAALLMTVAELHLIKPLARRYGSMEVVAVRTAVGGGFYLLVATPTLVGEPWLSLSGWTWIAILFGGAVGVGVGQWVKTRALHVLGPTRVVFYGNLVPLATVALAWLTIGTPLSTLELGAGLCIVAGAICLQVLDAQHRSEVMPG